MSARNNHVKVFGDRVELRKRLETGKMKREKEKGKKKEKEKKKETELRWTRKMTKSRKEKEENLEETKKMKSAQFKWIPTLVTTSLAALMSSENMSGLVCRMRRLELNRAPPQETEDGTNVGCSPAFRGFVKAG
ncbi:hypothetical protein LSTR_LSTR011034 [Laodelphax striatellus]|uniref:Uncharacterized protein n=1 Tax=Laodelphax striatellus TaxID=195883 RepID=A0A482WGG6_LAOST|nr:hypothetical protein LSTR_LSTR011034 [Laodelphax striatellus]